MKKTKKRFYRGMAKRIVNRWNSGVKTGPLRKEKVFSSV